jgi:hypothetical protein
VAAFFGEIRTQPCEAGLPSRFTSLVPWIAWPSLVKNTECGMGASSHSLLYHISFIELAV